MQIRDEARKLAPVLGLEKEFKQLLRFNGEFSNVEKKDNRRISQIISICVCIFIKNWFVGSSSFLLLIIVIIIVILFIELYFSEKSKNS